MFVFDMFINLYVILHVSDCIALFGEIFDCICSFRTSQGTDMDLIRILETAAKTSLIEVFPHSISNGSR